MKMKSYIVMKNVQMKLRGAKQILLSATLVLFLAQCAQDDELLTPPVQEDPATEAAAISPDEADVSSLTISGIHTLIDENVDCSTCTFVVAAGTRLVDGAAMKIKPGSVICLDKALKYNLLEFENLVGTAENPVTIGYCSK